MISSLFSVFDPCVEGISGFPVKWLIIMGPLFMMWWSLFCVPFGLGGQITFMIKLISNMVLNSTSFSRVQYMFIFIISVFWGVFCWNEVGLVPYGFTVSAQLVCNLSLSLSLFMCGLLVIFKIKAIVFISHLLPLGTPVAMAPVLVLVETIGMLVRPVSLAVRLLGNMVAGHLLVALLGELVCNLMDFMNGYLMLSMFLGMFLLLFEVAVGLVQALIFVTLVFMYWIEV